MIEYYFSSGCVRCKPRRRWGRVLMVIAALLAVLLACVLLSGCHTTQETSPKVHGVIIGLGAFAFVLLVYFVGRNARTNEGVEMDNFGEERPPLAAYGLEHEEFQRPKQTVAEWAQSRIRPYHADEIEAEMRWSATHVETWPPIPSDDLARIYGALAIRLCEARDMVRKATTDCGSEDYGDRLAGAERRLNDAIVCVSGLLNRAQKAAHQPEAMRA